MGTSSFGIGNAGGDKTSQTNGLAEDKERERLRLASISAENNRQASEYMFNTGGQRNQFSMPGDLDQQATRVQALSDINMLYGESPMQTGRDAKNYSDTLRANTGKNSLKSDLMRKTNMNDLYRSNAKAGLKGIDTAGASSNLSRRANYEADAYNQEYKDKALDKYGKNVGARVSGQYGVLTGKDAQGIANIAPSYPQAGGGGMFGSVICTELYSQGKLAQFDYAMASRYGHKIEREVFIGYLVIAKPLVFLMKKSDRFSKLFIGWGKDPENHIATKIMTPFARIIGKMVLMYGELCTA